MFLAGRSSRADRVGSSDFPVRNPRILERSDFLGLGLFSRWADEADRLPRSERRFDPRRDERRVPLGEYSDDMFSVVALHGRPAMRGDIFPAGTARTAVLPPTVRTPLQVCA